MNSADLTGDWRIWDNLETVAFVTEKGDLDYTQAELTAKRRALRFREMVPGGYVGSDLVWLVPSEFLPPSHLIKIGDRIQDADQQEWTILEPALNTWRTWWRLITRNFAMANSLTDRIALLAPDRHQDAAGGHVPEYSIAAEGIPAKIIETDASGEDRLGKRQMVRRFSCTVGRHIRPNLNYRLRDSNGVVYAVTGWRSVDRWDVLQELDLEIVK
jgi:hypothetical protein